MADDEGLLSSAPSEPVLRIYGWSPPGLSLGHFQSEDDARREIARFPGAVAVRRPTGGGAIYHDDEATYALVVPLSDPLLSGANVRESALRLDEPVVVALRELGVAARHRGGESERVPRRREPFFCFDRRSCLDIVVAAGDGRKIAGSAQRRTRTHLLQHGSVLLAGHPAIAGSVGVNDLAPAGARPVRFEELARVLARSFSSVLAVDFESAAAI